MTTRVVNTYEAESRLPELLSEAENGAEVIVARNGRPVAKIVPWDPDAEAAEPATPVEDAVFEDELVDPDADLSALFDESQRTTW